MNLILETDIGGDPDDFFAICYLLNAGVDIKAILVSPGHPYQVGIARFICDYCGVKIPIGVADPDKYKVDDYTGFYANIMKMCGIVPSNKYDGIGHEMAEDIFHSDPDVTFFAIGPMKNLGLFMKQNPYDRIKKFYMQGGFIGYDCHNDPNVVRLDKFEGKQVVHTYNLNGDINAGVMLTCMDVDDRRFISKNVNHTVLFDSQKYAEMLEIWHGRSPEVPYELFLKAAQAYDFQKREKKFHDPTAVACLLHPSIAQWADGQLYHTKQGWGFDPSASGSKITTSIDYDQLWECIMEGR